MIEVRQTLIYAEWFDQLRDRQAQARINVRIRRLSLGNPGDVRPVGEGVSELRIDYGPGYRVYFVQRGAMMVILLCGGDKSTQDRDVRTAKELARKETTPCPSKRCPGMSLNISTTTRPSPPMSMRPLRTATLRSSPPRSAISRARAAWPRSPAKPAFRARASIAPCPPRGT